MTSTLTETTALTAEDIKALRLADRVIFRHRNSVTTIEAGLERPGYDQPRIYTATEQRLYPTTDGLGNNERARVLTVSGSVTWYENDSRHAGTVTSTAFEVFHAPRYSEILTTVLSLLKPGDVLHVSFVGDAHSNGYSKKAGLHADALRLVVERGGKRLTFHLATSVCAPNTARMVKPLGG